MVLKSYGIVGSQKIFKKVLKRPLLENLKDKILKPVKPDNFFRTDTIRQNNYLKKQMIQTPSKKTLM
jgi:hypothetical protein